MPPSDSEAEALTTPTQSEVTITQDSSVPPPADDAPSSQRPINILRYR